jgi:hypothetical protein
VLQRLVYRSAPLRPPEGEILDILRVCDGRNLLLGCSGMLYYGNGTYAQVIEGPAEGVASLWASIRVDPRHRVLWRRQGPTPARTVGAGLPMGFLSEHEARADPRHAGLLSALEADVSGTSFGVVRAPGLGRALAEAARVKYPAAALPEAG